MRETVAVQESVVKPKRGRMRHRSLLSLYLLFAPTAILLFVFNYIPMYGIIISFQNYSIYKGILHSDWVGFQHYSYFLHDDKFWSIMKNTLLINFYDILFGFTAPIIFALLANELYQKTFKRVMQTVSYLPHFLSWIVVAGIFNQVLSPTTGIFNTFIGWFGFEPHYFMTDPSIFRGILVFADIWKGVGWSAILYFAVIAGIDSSLYEAAWIDGANRWKQTLYITIPHMMPMIVLLFLLKIAHIFGIGFERVFLMQNPLVYDVSDVISTYVYRTGVESSQYSFTTAISFAQSVLGYILLVSSNWVSKKWMGLGMY